MTTEHWEILVEEESMERALSAVLPKIIGAGSFRIYRHRGKPSLLENLPNRLQGYAKFLPSSHKIVVVVDRDNENCEELKARIEVMARNAGLRTKRDNRGPAQVIVRIAIEELEAWYFGDWAAVQAAYPKAHKPTQHCRAPDAIKGGTWEAFERCMKKSGYFASGLRKIEAATKIAPYIDPGRNTSPSFKAFCRAMERI